MAAISEERINLSRAARLKLSSETKVAQTQQFNIHCIRPGTLKLVDFAETKALFLPMAENFSSHRILTSPSQKERHPDGGRGKQISSTLPSAAKLPSHSDAREREANSGKAKPTPSIVSGPRTWRLLDAFHKNKKKITSRGVSGQPSRGSA